MAIETLSGTITSDEIKSLKDSPVTLIEAPDNGFLLPISYSFECVRGDTVYAGGSSIVLQYSSELPIGSVIASFLSQIRNQIFFSNATFIPYSPVDSSQLINQSIQLTVLSDDFTDGDGAINWSVNFQVVETA